VGKKHAQDVVFSWGSLRGGGCPLLIGGGRDHLKREKMIEGGATSLEKTRLL